MLQAHKPCIVVETKCSGASQEANQHRRQSFVTTCCGLSEEPIQNHQRNKFRNLESREKKSKIPCILAIKVKR